jgi:ribosomal protein S20
VAKTPRKWTGARTPSGLKRVRASERRHEILAPRRTAAKTLVKKAIAVATTQPEGADPEAALAEAMSALDLAAKVGAIHRNAAARRKARLARKINAALGGAHVQTAARASKTTGKAAAAKAAKARIAAAKAGKAKGAQTAAGKARVALSKTTRAETASAGAVATVEAPAKPAARASVTKSKATTDKPKVAPTKVAGAKAAGAKAAPKAAATPKVAKAEKPAATKAAGAKAAPKAAARKTTRKPEA